MKKYIFLLFLLCGCVAVFAQQKSTFTVSGQVFDDLDMPVPGASVFIKNSPGNRHATSNRPTNLSYFP